MKKVLDIGITEYNLSKHDPALEVKFKGLSKFAKFYVMARGAEWKGEKYGARFYLTPKKYGLPFWLVVVFFRSWSLIRREKIDVIMAQSPSFEGSMAGILRILTGKKFIVQVHGDWIESPFFYHELPFKKIIRWALIISGRLSFILSDKVRIISDFTRDLAFKYGGRGKPLYKFPTFMDVDKFLEEKDVSWDKTILYVGVLYRLKGVHFLIQAMAKLKSRHPEAELVIVGEGPYQKTLKDLAEEVGLERVRFMGRLPIDQVKDEMKRCSVLVLPSLSEGLGRVLVEAAALGKPLVGSDTGGIPEVIKDGENGFLITPGDVGSLAQKLDLLLSDEILAKKMGRCGQEMVKTKFSTGRYFQAFEEMIEL